jgi:translation initiation factor 3 subunit B
MQVGMGLLKWSRELYLCNCMHSLFVEQQEYATPSISNTHAHTLSCEQDFEWSPSEPILVAYTAEEHNMPARIVLVMVPERTEIRQKNLFNVSDVSIFWHPQVRESTEVLRWPWV